MQPQYRNYPQANQRSPHAAVAGRRGPGPGPMIQTSQTNPQLSQAQLMQAQREAEFKARQASEDAKRRAQEPVDKNIPPGVADVVIGDGVARYESLQDIERRLDSAIVRKRLDLQDSVHRTPKHYKTMRIWISNTVENQPWQATVMDPDAFDFQSNVVATFRVKIEGRLLDDESAASEAGAEQANGRDNADNDGEPAAKRTKLTAAPPRKKLSHFFKAITVNFDRSRDLQPDGYTQIDWKKPEHESDFDAFEFESKSDENINVTINLVRDENPERYRLSKPLADLLDTEEDDRQGVLMGIWEYIREMRLQEDQDKRRIVCDEKLRTIFNTDKIFFPHLQDMIQMQLMPLPPISLAYTIRVDREFQEAGSPVPTIYDVPVAIDDPLKSQVASVIQSKAHFHTLEDIKRINARIALTVQATTHAKAKHDFFTSLSKDPATFVKRWISSQKRDLDVILGGGVWNAEDWSSSEWRTGGADGPWGSTQAWESVGGYLNKIKAGHEFRGA